MTSMGQAARTEVVSYDVSALTNGRVDELPAGSNLLISGPAMVGKDTLTLRSLAQRQRDDQHTVIVTSDKNAERVIQQIESLDIAVDPADFYVVDCSGTSGRGTFEETANVKYVNSPGDLTGIGIGIAKCTSEIGNDAENGLGMGVISLSTLLQYSTANRVFNFAHVMTGRINAAGYLGLWTLDSGSHDPQTANTIKAQFDYIFELRERDDGQRELRILGGPDDWRTWEPLEVR